MRGKFQPPSSGTNCDKRKQPQRVRVDVSARASEVNVERLRDFELTEKPGQTGKVWIRDAGAIVTLRVRGVIAQYRHRFRSILDAKTLLGCDDFPD